MNLPQSIQPVDATHVRYRGRRLVYFGGCDYYRLARHPHLLKAHARAAARDGLGTGASRMTTGNHPAHDALEAELKKARTAAKLTNGLPRKKGEDGTFTAIGRTWRDPHPRGAERTDSTHRRDTA